MPKFVLSGDTRLETLRAILPDVIPVTVERELILCKDCRYCITIEKFPDHQYCEGRMFGKCVDHEFFCADGERR